MKKTKRYAGEDGSLVEDDEINLAVKAAKKPDVEAMKSGIASGAAAKEDEYAPKTRTFSKTGPEKPKPAAPKKASQSFGLNPREKDLQPASEVMKRGRAGESDSGANPSLDRLKGDREAETARKKRKMDFAMERVKAGIGYKSGGSVGSASKRADGCAQRGKTKGRMV